MTIAHDAHPPTEDHDDTIEAHYASLERPHACLEADAAPIADSSVREPTLRPRGGAMDEQTRKGRELNALEVIAAELEKLRVLREYEIGAEVRAVEGNMYVQPIEK
jgi:hypothetical protein